ncbi:MAG: sulfatase-like hydrolase/transferase [Chloroflexi bacterium]|nr:sulfatase-like hydrolase/transferase [Chloroflexota bacterium]
MTPINEQAASSRAPHRPPTRPPNVLLIISDQQRADTMPGRERPSVVETPHVNWLARGSTLFRHAYCVSPLCTPARVSLLSGLYPHTTGMVANNQPRPITEEMRLPPDVILLADYLRPLGYACGYTGKWHLGTGGDRRGFGDFVTRSADFDVDGPEHNATLRFGAKVGAAVDANYVRNFNPADYDRRTQVGSTLLPGVLVSRAAPAVRQSAPVRPHVPAAGYAPTGDARRSRRAVPGAHAQRAAAQAGVAVERR